MVFLAIFDLNVPIECLFDKVVWRIYEKERKHLRIFKMPSLYDKGSMGKETSNRIVWNPKQSWLFYGTIMV